MRFEYEITADEYVAAQLLNYKHSRRRKRVYSAITWILAGVLLIVVSWSESVLNLGPILLAGIGVWWIYGGLTILFPARHFRRNYLGDELAGRRFKADVNEEGFEVRGDWCSWGVRWPAVRLKSEDNQVFIFFAEGSIFIFGKRYLSADQQQQLRTFGGL